MSLTTEQVAARANGIGGSDAAAALGLSKRKTVRQLYHEKRGEIPPDVFDAEVIWWGNALEPVVRQKYAEKTGHTVLLPKETLWHPAHAFMCAHIDGYVDAPRRGYEGKTAFLSTGWGEEGTDQVPSDCLMQVHHYMIVTDLPVFDVACLIGRRFAYYEVPADPELHQMIIEGEREFARRVKDGDPPPLDYEHPTALDVMKRLHRGTNGVRLIASEGACGWRRKIERAQRIEKAAKARIDAYKSRLLEEMGDAALLAFPDGKCYRRQVTPRAAYSVDATEYVDARFINDPLIKGKKR
jgi:putative phage-type endonuclease